jgi:hypothetical protein
MNIFPSDFYNKSSKPRYNGALRVFFNILLLSVFYLEKNKQTKTTWDFKAKEILLKPHLA